MENKSKKVVINVTKNARDENVLTVLYDDGNGLQSPFNMDKETSSLATYIARKSRSSNPDFIYINPYTKKEVFNPDFMYDFEYCISGTDGDPLCLISTLVCATENQDIKIPLYIVSGEKVVKINDEHSEEWNHNYDENIMLDRINIEKELFSHETPKTYRKNH